MKNKNKKGDGTFVNGLTMLEYSYIVRALNHKLKGEAVHLLELYQNDIIITVIS